MEKKFIYEAPEMEQIKLQSEGKMLTDSNRYGSNGEAGGPIEEGDTYNL